MTADSTTPASTWSVRPLGERETRAAEVLVRELGVRGATARLLAQRGLGEVAAAARFLDPRLGQLRAPEAAGQGIAGFAAAADGLMAALAAGTVIGVFGDYDVDGITSAAVLAGYLHELGGQVVTRVARRDGGYGFGVADAEALLEAGARLVVTCDTGTSDLPALQLLRARGAHAIVIDHHQVPEGDPTAHPALLVNPHRPDDRFPFKGLASVGLAFYLACALRSRRRAAGLAAPDPKPWLDLVAIGTLCDQAPLLEENRILVRHGLEVLNQRRRPGLRALLVQAGIDSPGPPGAFDPEPRRLDEISVTFKLGPRLNAPGRLGSAQPALELLVARDDAAARVAAAAIEDVNRERQRVQDLVMVDALAQADALLAAMPERAAVVVAGAGWPAGVVGIVAAKLVDRHARPALVIALEAEAGAGAAGAVAIGRGSARTVAGIDLYQALARCAGHLMKWGGHAAAAGVTLAATEVDAFRAAFEGAVEQQLAGSAAGRRRGGVVVDGLLGAHEVDAGLCEDLARLSPFGAGNPEPLLLLRGMETAETRIVGDKHLKLSLLAADGSTPLEAIAFRQAEHDPGVGRMIDLACLPRVDRWRGQRRVQLEVRALREHIEASAARSPELPVATTVEVAATVTVAYHADDLHG